MNVKKILNKKILIITGICLIIIIILCLLFVLKNNKQHLEINKSVDILIGGYSQIIKVKSLDKAYLVNEDKYLRIDIEIENRKNMEANTSLHQFILVDSNNEEIAMCYHAEMIDTELPDVLPNKLIANGITSGYLYCPTESTDVSKLKITVISGGKIDANNEITYEYQDYYIDLKK